MITKATQIISRIVDAMHAETGNLKPQAPGEWELQPNDKPVAVRVFFEWQEKTTGAICRITFAPQNILSVPLYAILLPGGWMEVYFTATGENVHPFKVGVSER